MSSAPSSKSVQPPSVVPARDVPTLEMLAIARGMRGPQGEKGDVGDPADIGEMPDLVLIFENRIV